MKTRPGKNNKQSETMKSTDPTNQSMNQPPTRSTEVMPPQASAANLPYEVKKKLLALSGHLPESARGDFLRRAGSRLSELALEHPRTIVFTALGFTLGSLLEAITTIPYIEIELLGDLPTQLGTMGGAGYGFWKDREAAAIRNRVAVIVREEMLSAHAGSV